MATIPSISLIPSGYKAGKVYSVLPTDGSADFDFSRNTTATRINKDGLIENVGNNVPRLDYQGGGCPSLLLEPQKTNRVPNSDQFSGTTSNVSVYRNQVISLDGTLNADRLLDNNAAGEHLITGSYTGSITNGLDYTSSAFFKSDGTGGQGVIRFYTGTQNYAVFNLENGTISYTSNGVSKIENYGNGWYRCSLTVAATINYGNTITQLATGNSLNQFSYQGASSLGVYFWGAQYEQSSYATSYIPTSGSAQTRLRDLSDTQNLSNVIGQTEGVIFYDAILVHKSINTSEDLFELTIDDGTNQNIFFINNYNNTLAIGMRSGGSSQFSNNSFNPIEGAGYKLAFAYKQNDFALYINGNQIATDTSGTVPAMNQITFGNYYNNQINLQNSTKVNDFKLYNTRLTNTELETLTSYTSFNAMALALNYTIQ